MSWRNLLRAYDETALAELANPGLVRRAAKKLDAVTLLHDEPERADFTVADATVSVAGKTLPDATCTCPAPGLCWHLIAVALWARQEPGSGLDEPAGSAAIDALLATEPSTIFAWAGKPACRKAYALYGKLREPQGRCEISHQAVLIRLPELDFECRFLPATGVDGMVASSPDKAYQLCAILAALAAHGVQWQWPDHALPAAEQPLTSQDRKLLTDVVSTSGQLLEAGLLHVSAQDLPPLVALSRQAAADGFPRLARLLGRVVGQVEELAARGPHADVGRTLEVLAKLLALCDATAAATPDNLPHWRGEHRSGYASADDDLHAIGLGGYRWETASGYVGLTLLFLDAGSGHILSASNSRHEDHLGGFSPEQAWEGSGWWQGAGSPHRLAGSRLAFKSPRISAEGRLSLSQQTTVSLSSEPATAADLGELISDWTRLDQLGSDLLDRPLILKPVRSRTLWFDEVQQAWLWVVEDAGGVGLILEFPHQSSPARAKALFDYCEQRAPHLSGVVVQPYREPTGIRFEPLIVLRETRKGLEPLSLTLHQPEQPKIRSWLARVRRLQQTLRPAEAAATRPGPRVAQQLLEPVVDRLQGLAESGLAASRPATRAELRGDAQRLGELGLSVVAQMLNRAADDPSARSLLRACHTVQVCLDGAVGFPVVGE